MMSVSESVGSKVSFNHQRNLFSPQEALRDIKSHSSLVFSSAGAMEQYDFVLVPFGSFGGVRLSLGVAPMGMKGQ